MTQRSIQAGTAPHVVIKAGGSVSIKGYEAGRVTAETGGRGMLKVERRGAAEIARARAAIGERVLFDLRLKLPNWEGKQPPDEVIEVQFGGNGQVQVPFDANLKVFAGGDIRVHQVRGQVDATAGRSLKLEEVFSLGRVSAGWAMALECQTMAGDRVEFSAGSDLRFHVRDLTSAYIRVKDIGGYWEGRIGGGEKSIYLKAGGEATLVTDQEVEAQPPDYILGKIEKPPGAA